MKKVFSLLALAVLPCTAHPDHSKPTPNSAVNSAPFKTAVATGNGLFSFEVVSRWGQLPEGKNIGPTHGGVAVSADGTVFVSTDAGHGICCFRPDGSFIKYLGKETQGLHSLLVNKEGDKEFLYGAQGSKQRLVKLDLDGKLILEIPNKNTGAVPGGWTKKNKDGTTQPVGPFRGITASAVAPNGDIFVACGYGSNLIHKFDSTGKILKTFGGRSARGDRANTMKFQTCHGLAIDRRFGKPRLLVVDRENGRLLHYTLDFEFIDIHAKGLRRPCAVSFYRNQCGVAELAGRATVLGKNGVPVAFLGDNPNTKQRANFGVPAGQMKPDFFTAPHGLSYDHNGNLIIQDWNKTGRVTMLKHVKR